jgi:pyruvate/2-oxoglutarate dehydrogenase complex dihydrolipoamide dehydrogenase (E3) component
VTQRGEDVRLLVIGGGKAGTSLAEGPAGTGGPVVMVEGLNLLLDALAVQRVHSP